MEFIWQSTLLSPEEREVGRLRERAIWLEQEVRTLREQVSHWEGVADRERRQMIILSGQWSNKEALLKRIGELS